MKFDIVIAGGGFTGAYCARALARAIGPVEGEKRVALISERNVLVFQPMLAEVAGSSLAPLDVVNPLRVFCRGVNVLQGAIQKVDWASKSLVLDGGRFTRNHKVGFSHLVLALGSVTDLSGVPGMAEYGWPMKNVADALRLRAALVNRLEEANLIEEREARRRLLTFVVVGGGYTGVETAGQILDFTTQAHRYYANLRDCLPKVILVHSGAELLGGTAAELGAYARSVLQSRGLEVRLNVRVNEVTACRVNLSDGSAIDANTIVTSIGSAPNPLVVDLCRQLGIEAPKGRIGVDATLRVVGQDCLWAAGDCASVPWLDQGKTKVAPQTAQFALRQGRQLGENLALLLHGEKARPFRYRYRGQLASIGQRAAVAEVMGRRFTGFWAWWLWRTVYLAKLPGTLRKLRVMIDWTFELIFPRDISVLAPPPEDVVRAIHLEAGETLFTVGTECRAFYYLRSGSISLEAGNRAPRSLPAGSVIDNDELDEAGVWAWSATAYEACDLTVFRGRMHALLKKELRLTRRARWRPPGLIETGSTPPVQAGAVSPGKDVP
jgi:NADH dehydrogenase